LLGELVVLCCSGLWFDWWEVWVWGGAVGG